MSIYKDGKLIAGGRQTMPLLSFMWADHQLNDISWLRADTFSWQSGAVYTAVYQHLVDDIDGITAESETVGGITISFYRAPDGHKITTDESAVLSIYNATGVAWYYIIDTTNQRFKLPRTKFGFTGLRDTVGGYVEPELPNVVGEASSAGEDSSYLGMDGATGAFYCAQRGHVGSGSSGSAGYTITLGFDASRSSSVYKDGATVQPPATQMYLYFYVGQFTQTALENTAGVTTETLNGKVDKGHQVVEFQEPTAANNYTWYRKYADGWVEQGGYYAYTTTDVNFQIVLPVSMESANYTIITTLRNNNTNAGFVNVDETSGVTATGFYCRIVNKSNAACSPLGVYWQVSGLSAN